MDQIPPWLENLAELCHLRARNKYHGFELNSTNIRMIIKEAYIAGFNEAINRRHSFEEIIDDQWRGYNF